VVIRWQAFILMAPDDDSLARSMTVSQKCVHAES